MLIYYSSCFNRQPHTFLKRMVCLIFQLLEATEYVNRKKTEWRNEKLMSYFFIGINRNENGSIHTYKPCELDYTIGAQNFLNYSWTNKQKFWNKLLSFSYLRTSLCIRFFNDFMMRGCKNTRKKKQNCAVARSQLSIIMIYFEIVLNDSANKK